MNDENEREDGQEIDAGLAVPHAGEADEVRQALLTSSVDEEGPTAAAAARKLQGYVYKAHALSQLPESEFKTEQERFAAADAIARGMTGQDDPLGRLWNGGKGFETGGEYLRSVKETFMRGMQAAATPRLQQYLAADEDEKNRLASEAAPTLGRFANWMGDVYVSSGPLNEGEMASAPDDVREASEALKSAMVDEDPEAKKAAEEKVLGWRRNGKHLMEYRAAYEEKLMRENALMFLPDVLKHLKGEDARKLCSEIIDHPERRPADYGERLKALDTGDIEIIGRINHMVTPRGEGGFWNTIGDAALAALSSVNGVLRGGAGQLYKGYAGLNNLGAELLTDEPEAWKIDYNAALRRRTALWAAGEGLGADINQISEDHGMVASGLIGIAGVLPVLPMFHSAAGLGTLTVESMAQMDERMVREGVDVTDPKYVAGSMLAAGLQTYVMKRGFAKTFGAKMTEKEAIEIQTAWLKGVMAGLSKMPTYRNLTAHTLGGAMAMGLSAGIGEINASIAKNGIDADALSEGGKAFVEEFVGSIPDMAVFAGSGMLKGHAERSGGWRRMFTDAGLATRDAGLKGVMERKYTWLSSQHVSDDLDRQRFETGAMWLAQAHRVYSSGGKDALAKTGLKAETVEELADFFEQERIHAGSRATPTPAASEESRVKSEKSGGRRKGRGGRKGYYRAQVGERRRERDIENWNRQEEELGRKAGELMKRFFENRENAERLIDELEPIRNIWAKGGGMIETETKDGKKITNDPGQAALIKAGFSEETAKEFSDIFREEQRRRCSPAAFNGIQAIYERSTRGMTTARGQLDSVLPKGRVTERDGRAFVNFTKPTGESVDAEISRGAAEFTLEDVSGKSGDNMAGQVEERTKGKVKAADWAAMTPEERLETVKRYNLVQAGNFVLTDPHDPSITVDTDGARRIVGRIETPAVGGKPFHEVAHGYFRFMQESGFWTEADIKWLRETFGEPRAKNGFFDKDGKKVRRDELFNEEAACDAVQAYAAKKLSGSLTDEPPALRKLWTFARRMVHLTERRVAEEKLAADREQALYDAILTGTFSHIADLKVAEKPVAPKPSEGGEGAAAPQTGTLPKESGRFKTVTKTQESVTKTGTEAAKPTEGAVKPEVKPEVTFEALTPTGGKKIRGHYEFVPLAKLLHSNKPGYPMELQGRDRKDNKAEQQTRNDHVANFEAGYLLADPKTDSGAMVVVKRPADGGGVEYVVVSGNGRTMVLEDLAAKNLYDRYRNPAKAFAAENGIENGVPDGENPVLVRVIDDLGGATLKEIADLSNTNAIQQMNEEEQARADADTILKLDIARLYAANADGSPNMTPGANADFFREFVKGIGDTGMLNSDGSVTEALRLRAQRALLAIACGQGERGRDTVKALVEQAATLGIERQKEAAAAMAPHVAAAEARPEFAIGPDVSRAFADFLDFMRNRDTGKKWGTVEEYLKQGDMLDPRSEIAGSILRMLGERKSPGYVAEVARTYAEAAKGEQDGLFGEARKPAEIWREAEKAVAEDGGKRWSIVKSDDTGIERPYLRFGKTSQATDDALSDSGKPEAALTKMSVAAARRSLDQKTSQATDKAFSGSGNAGSYHFPVSSVVAARRSLDQLARIISNRPKAAQGVFNSLRAALKNIENGKPIFSGGRELSAKNFVTSMQALGFSRKAGANSAYLVIGGDSAVRASDHSANAELFVQDGTDNNLSIVIRRPGRVKKFNADDAANVVEAVFTRRDLDAHPEKLPYIVRDIAEFIATGEYHDTAGAMAYNYSGSENYRTAARDRIHADAIARGDMATAARMVREAAEKAGYIDDSSYQGTSAFNGAAPSANGYYANKEERKAAWEDGSYEGEATFGDYIFDGIDINNLEVRLNDREWRYATPERKEAIENLNSVLSSKGKTIKMFRSVPSDVKEGSFRNGDWITPSRSYATENARIHGWGKKFRIIEQEVSVEDVWWDGNDIAEWGFDDGKEYAYRNTKNNRKLLAPATYDDAGKLIPLSQRFDTKRSDVRWSIATRLDEEQQLIEERGGKLILAHHGTDSRGFTRFEKSDDLGYFFAKSRKTAASYIRKGRRGDENKPGMPNYEDVMTFLNDEASGYTPEEVAAMSYEEKIQAYTEGTLENSGVYDVALKMEDPYVIDCHGANWNSIYEIPDGMDQTTYDRVSFEFDPDARQGKLRLRYEEFGEDSEADEWFDNLNDFIRVCKERFGEDFGRDELEKIEKAYSNGEYYHEDVIDGRQEKSEAGAMWTFDAMSGEGWGIYPKKTREIVEDAANMGCDGVIFHNVVDNGGGIREADADDVYVVMKPEQVKSVDSMTYADDGSIIPAEKRLDWTNRDIRWSVGQLYTGSAADYEKPSLLKVGTGEGAQVYGWGLYASSVRSVAETYTDSSYDKNTWARNYLAKHNGDRSAAVKELKYAAKYVSREARTAALGAAKLISSGKPIPKTGNIYEQTFFTNRAPGDESHLLKWYEPISDEQQKWIADQISKEGLEKQIFNDYHHGEYDDPGTIGQSLSTKYDSVEDWLKNSTAAKIYEGLEMGLDSPQAASEFLARADIDGIKYPVDSYGGKTVKNGDTAGWNYVSFRDDNIRVDHKWVDGVPRWSITKLDDGTDIALVRPNDVPSNIKLVDRDSVEKFILAHIEDAVPSLTGTGISITELSAKHFARSPYAEKLRRKDRKMLRARNKTIGILKDIISLSTADDTTETAKDHPEENYRVWECTVPFGVPEYDEKAKLVGGKVFDAKVIIEDRGKGKIFYDLVDLKENGDLSGRLTKHTELFETGRGGTDPSRVDQGSPSASPSADLRSPAVIGETPRSIAQSAADGNADKDPFFALGNQKRRREAERRDPEAVARQAIVALTQGGEEDKTSALVAFVAYRDLTGGAKPRAKTISTLGFQMGMKTVAVGKIVREGEGLAKRMRDTVIAEACERGDVATAMAMLARERMADAAAERIVSGAAQRGGYLKEKGEIAQKAIMEREISKLVRATNAATLEDMERDTGLDLASEILAADPDKFDPSKAQKKGEGGSAPDEQSSGDGGGDGADAPADVPFEELTDLQKARRKERQAAAEKRVAEMIEKAKARAEKKAANRKANADAAGRDLENQAAFDAENGGEGGGGAAAGAAEAEKPNLKTFADFKTKEEFAAFLRAWATDAFAKSIGIRELTKAGKHRLFAEFYRKTVIRELSDLADKLLPPKGARAWANRRLGEIEQGTAPDTIERISGDVFALINRNAIREERTALIQKFRNDVRRYYNGEKFDEFKQDTDRKLTGWIEESARYIHRVCNLAIRSINGEPSQIEQEREKLREIIDKRSEIHDESGKKTVDWAITDDKARRALAKLELLDRFGGMKELMPGEIADRTAEALEYLEKKAGELEKSWEETRRVTDGLIRDFAGGVIGPKGGMRYERGKGVGAWFDGLADALNGMIRLRLQHLTRFADPKAKEAADRAINSFVTMLGDGEVAYSRITDRDRKAFAKALHAIFKGDNARIEEWMNRMTENIPVELSRQISNQGFAEGMTYGQMFQLLVSIEQGSLRPNVEANGRDGQSRLIRDWIIDNPDGTRTRMFTSEDALFVDWLREFYKSTRAEASKVTERMNGMPIYSPDPLYCPVKMYMGDVKRDWHGDTGRWDPVGSVFARRVENLRDFDESASVLGMFFDRSAARAQLIAWAERGTILRNVFTDVGVRNAIERAFGKGEYSRIAKQIEQTMTGGQGAKKTPGEIAAADKAMNYITYASLGFNPLSAMKQTTSFPVWANAIGWTRLWHHMTHFDKAALKHLMESEEFKVRYGDQVNGGMDIATRGLNENPGRSRVAQMFQKWSMGLLKIGDFAPGGWIAQGVYKDFLDKHLKDGMEFDAADRLSLTETFNLLEETQQSGRTYNTNELSREHGRIGRLLTQFATSPLQQLQYETQAFREVRDLWKYRPAAKDAAWEKNFADAKAKLVRAVVINHVLLPAALHSVTNIYKLAMGYDPEWEQDGWHQTLLRDLLLGQFSRVFYIGTMAQTTFDALVMRKNPMNLSLLPSESAITQAANIAITARDVFMGMDPEKMRKDIDRLLKSTSVTRTPYDLIWRATGRDMNQRKEFIRKGRMPK